MTDIPRAHISFRIGPFLWDEPARCAEVMALVAHYRDTLDEVAFFTGFTHPPLPLATMLERARGLAKVLPRFTALGVTAGINYLSTIGHLNENLAYSLNEPWQRIMDVDGGTAAGVYCPADPHHQEYVADTYRAMAQAGPAFIWVDDDVRLEGNGPVRQSCFCDRCLAAFSAESGTTWTRPTLKATLNNADLTVALPLRRQWLAHNRETIRAVLERIRAVVDSVDPAIMLGFMTCSLVYSGNGFTEWAAALAGPHHIPVKFRPGGGFYTDENPTVLLGKAHSIGQQIYQLPASVTDIQYEHENFPYQVLKKSLSVFTAEIAASMGAGCTGVALNLCGITPDPIEEYHPRFAAVQACRPFFDAVVSTFGRSQPEGFWVPVPRDHFAAMHAGGDWFSAPTWCPNVGFMQELSEIGLPIAYAREGASATLFSGDNVLAYSVEELKELLAGGVFLDGPALRRLHELGLGDYTGFAISGEQVPDMLERFTDDPLNGRFSGWSRDCRPSFWPQTTYLLRPLTAGSRPLARAYDFANTDYGPVAGVYENGLGGRVAVFGYYPWSSLQSLAKASQIRQVCRWLTRELLPAYIPSFTRAALWARRDVHGHPALLVLNASIDAAERLQLAVRSDAPTLNLTRMDGHVVPLERSGADGPYGLYTIDHLGPWQAGLVTR